jgi:hypothetical protein
MTWTINTAIIGTSTCTQFKNAGADELNPQTAYSTTPFITSNTTTSQFITFANFDTLTKTQSVSTKTLVATSTSGLTVSFTSLNTSIATITGGNTLNALTSGTVSIVASQAGNGTYDAATPITCIFTITIEQEQPGPTGKLEVPLEITANTSKSNVKNITVSIQDIRYTQYSGISYGYATGFHGSSMVGSITCTDGSDNPITDFSDNPLNITISMSNANPAHVYKIWKRSGSTVIDPQPTGYPVTLTYQSGYNWTASMTSLSDIVILDDTPPAGNAGGDPYIISVKKIKTLLPNEWSKVNLLDTENTHIIANCEFISQEIISNLHYINKNKKECVQIDPSIHKWVKDLTYITSLEFINKKTNKKLIFDTIDGSILLDNSGFLYESVTDNKYGLFSITHFGYYPHVNFKKYLVHFDEGHLAISIDNFWDDINYIQLFIHNDDYSNFTGELINHDESNAIEKSNKTE